jgi:signal transduction histidine kinase
LQQVVLNLIVNSRDAIISAGAGTRELRISSWKSPDGNVHVAVRDSGVGVKLQDLNKMFDAFYTTKPKGMGMGLAVSRSIVEAHGGSIWATPNDDSGLTVEFSIPSAKRKPK